MRRALITGGTGLVGHPVTQALRARGWQVTHLARRPVPGAEWLHFTLDAPPERLPAADALIHAAFDHVPGRYRGGEGEDPDGFRRRNLNGTLALFRAARAADIPRAVFLSSRAVFDACAPGTLLTEDMAPAPASLYGRLKAETEAAITALATPSFAPLTLRATGVYGPPPPDRAHKWAGLFADFLRGQPIAPRVGTELHAQDLAAAVLLLLEASAQTVTGRAFHASDITLDRHDLLSHVARLAGSPHPPPPRADATRVSPLDCAGLGALGWQPGGWPLLQATLPRLLPHPPGNACP
ncbi:NAD(P)-dependent oxidoreductase [Halovulum dunhuangense]|uniref:NAD(P)-dependent oxidoreductase n=1 Tax=Halovulum dunhuangense TaxID=1505036 RepID=A0A849L613_9RHOB|nr:NAD(P)-dependent oxidoreductase [Halovulum dunhuangense]NNU81594.1 NAD(P)-dependent oxidoreductase [Halovulum dunhuangense]